MHRPEMDEHGREESPDLAVTDFGQTALPFNVCSTLAVFGDEKWLQKFFVLTQSRKNTQGNTQTDQNCGKRSDARQHPGGKFAAVEKPFLSGFVLPLFLLPFLAGDAGGLLIFRVAWIPLVLVQQRRRG